MKPSKALVQLSEGPDHVTLWVDLPDPFASQDPRLAQTTLSVNFQTGADRGVEYVKQHFNLEPEVINRRWVK
jgi:hypothetical protein